jgi:hypothetical protein
VCSQELAEYIISLEQKLSTLSDKFDSLCAATGWHILEGE